MKLRLYWRQSRFWSQALWQVVRMPGKAVQARVPALAPAATAAAQAPPELPSSAGEPGRTAARLAVAPVPAGKEYLIQKVQEKFASGEQNFKAGHLEPRARILTMRSTGCWRAATTRTAIPD